MASVYKRSNSKIWQCSFYVPDAETGERVQVRKSTGAKTRTEALRAAAELERAELENVGSGGGKARRIQGVLTRAGEEAVRETLNAARARIYMEEILKISTGEELPTFTLSSWFDEWLRRKEKRISAATRARYRTSLKAFREWLGPKADKPLESVTVASVVHFRDDLQSEGRAARTCNHYVRDLASAFRTAVVEGLIGSNPASAVDALSPDDSIQRQPFTKEEVALLIQHGGSEDWKGVILVAVFTGLRLGDIARLKWENVDIFRKSIRVMPAKTKRKKKVVEIPMHPELQEYLLKAPNVEEPEAPLFPSLFRCSISGRKGLSMTFVGIMEKAEVSRGETREVEKVEEGEESREGAKRAGRTVHARGFHSLRHTFTSMLANADVPEELRMAMTGHSDVTVHQGYTHHDLSTLSRAVEKIPKIGEAS